MRICFLCQPLDTLGGLQRAVVLLANELAERGEQVAVLMDRPSLEANPYGLSEKVEILDTACSAKPSVAARYVSKVRRHSGFPRPTVRNGRLPESVVCEDNLAAIRACLTDGEFDYVVGCDPFHTVIAAYAREGTNVPVCGWQHSTYDGYFRQRGRGFYGLDGLFASAIRKCKLNFVLTDESRKVYKRETGCSAVVLPNAITSLGKRSTGENRVLYCGRLDPGSKGADYLPEIASGLAKAGFDGVFEVVGDGPYRSELERWIVSADLSFQMELAGFVSDAERYYEQASVLISPSRWEGFGLSILEGMAHGVPCVAFDNDGPRSIITDGVDGFIVPNGSTNTLVEKVAQLISDDGLRTRMGDLAVETARGYLVQAQADTFLSALEDCKR